MGLIFPDGEGVGLTVDGPSRGDIDDLLNPMSAREFEKMERSPGYSPGHRRGDPRLLLGHPPWRRDD